MNEALSVIFITLFYKLFWMLVVLFIWDDGIQESEVRIQKRKILTSNMLYISFSSDYWLLTSQTKYV